MLEEKVKALMAALHGPRSETSPPRLVSMIADVMATAHDSGDVEPAVFALLPAEARVAAFSVLLATLAGTITK